MENQDQSKTDRLAIISTTDRLKDIMLVDAVKEAMTLIPHTVATDPEGRRNVVYRFAATIMKIARSNPAILECTQESFKGAFLSAVGLNLLPDPFLGLSALVPFYNGKIKRKELSFQPMYQGLLELSFRSNKVKNIYADAVYEADVFEYEYGTEAKLKHVPALKDRGGFDKIIGFYAVAETTTEGKVFKVLGREEVDKFKTRFSKAAQYEGSIWETDYDQMGKKTVVKQLMKFLPKTEDMRKAITIDSRSEGGKATYFDTNTNDFVEDSAENKEAEDDGKKEAIKAEALAKLNKELEDADTKEKLETFKKSLEKKNSQGLLSEETYNDISEKAAYKLLKLEENK